MSQSTKFIIHNYNPSELKEAESKQVIYPSKLRYYNDAYTQGDYCTISSIKVNDLFKAVGSIKIIEDGTNTLTFTGEKSIQAHYYDPANLAADLTATFAPYQITFTYALGKFSVAFDDIGHSYEMLCTGNMKLLIGFYFDSIFDASLAAILEPLDPVNSYNIEHIKVVCKQLNACAPTCYQNQLNVFTSDTVAVMHKSHLQFINTTMDVHMPLIANCPLDFELQDQNSNPIDLTYCIIEGIMFKRSSINFNDEVQTLVPHKKQQAHLVCSPNSLNTLSSMTSNSIINTEMYFTHIALQSLSGTIYPQNLLDTPEVTDLLYEIYINEVLVTIARVENINFSVLNPNLWVWQKFERPVNKFNVRVERVSVSNGSIVATAAPEIPNLILRVLLK